MLLISRTPSLIFVNNADCGGLVVPGDWFAKLRLAGDKLAARRRKRSSSTSAAEIAALSISRWMVTRCCPKTLVRAVWVVIGEAIWPLAAQLAATGHRKIAI